VENATGEGDLNDVSRAVNAYADDVSAASQILSQPTEPDQTVIVLADRLTTDYVRHEHAIVDAESRAPSRAMTMSVERADASVEATLALAIARGQAHGQPASAILVSAAGSPTAASSPTIGVAARTNAPIAAASPNPIAGASPNPIAAASSNPIVAAQPRPIGATAASTTPVATPNPPPTGSGSGDRERDNERHHPVTVDHWVFKPKWVPAIRPTPPPHHPGVARGPSTPGSGRPNQGPRQAPARVGPAGSRQPASRPQK
jgi:hypothetical protein